MNLIDHNSGILIPKSYENRENWQYIEVGMT
jgi:hypothetical protein